jgi:hypothetical protein
LVYWDDQGSKFSTKLSLEGFETIRDRVFAMHEHCRDSVPLPGKRMNRLGIILGATALLAAPALFWAAAEFGRRPAPGAYAAPGLQPVGPEAAREDLSTLLPALLLVVYDAFGRKDEAEIYDTLAVAAAGEALENLYLERVGAMVGGGTESDQTIHVLHLVEAASEQSGETFRVDARWQVFATVSHSVHVHVRRNTYRANLTIAPVEGAWKITDFELTDVDRQTAGEPVEADLPWWN